MQVKDSALRSFLALVSLPDGVKFYSDDGGPLVLVEPNSTGGYALRQCAYLYAEAPEGKIRVAVVRLPILSIFAREGNALELLAAEILDAARSITESRAPLIEEGGTLPRWESRE